MNLKNCLKLAVLFCILITTFVACGHTNANANTNTNTNTNTNATTNTNLKTTTSKNNGVSLISKNNTSSASKKNNEFDIAIPESVGLDPKILNSKLESYKDTNLSSLLIVKDNKLVFERYFRNNTKDSINTIYSATKSFTSALIGIAIDNGYIENTDIKVSTYFPDYFKDQKVQNKKDLTLKHLLTMTSGFVENDPEFIRSLFYSNAIKYTLELPLKYKPGEKFQYSSQSSHLLSVILRIATGDKADTFAKKHLFNELGITNYRWATDALGDNTGAFELYLNSRDMLKFGMLYLQEGNWKEKQLISKSWIEESTTKKVDTNDDSIGKDNHGYAYQWWIDSTDDYDYFTAAGYGGQFICVVKELNLVVVATSIPPERSSIKSTPEIKNILNEVIIPALK